MKTENFSSLSCEEKYCVNDFLCAHAYLKPASEGSSFDFLFCQRKKVQAVLLGKKRIKLKRKDWFQFQPISLLERSSLLNDCLTQISRWNAAVKCNKKPKSTWKKLKESNWNAKVGFKDTFQPISLLKGSSPLNNCAIQSLKLSNIKCKVLSKMWQEVEVHINKLQPNPILHFVIKFDIKKISSD